MKRPSWLDPSISFCKDTPDCKKAITPVLLDIHCRDSKVWNWGVEIDFIGRASASCGAWAQIDNIADCCGGEPLKCAASNGPAMRGSWFQFNFKTVRNLFHTDLLVYFLSSVSDHRNCFACCMLLFSFPTTRVHVCKFEGLL